MSDSGQMNVGNRIAMLDGWRATSILMVLVGHLFPLGPSSWQLNAAVAASGMALFFTLSGFLITQFLLAKPDVPEFLRRRLFRIVPLAWSAMLVLIVINRADLGTILANILFYANLPPQHLMLGGTHLWSLCVEVQFYLGVALIVALFGRRGLYALPALCVAVTILRVVAGTKTNIVTWYRVDEILAGASVALVYAERRWAPTLERLPALLPMVLLVSLPLVALEYAGPIAYSRPYIAAAAIGSSLYSAPELMKRAFASRISVYIAEISYSIYVFHGMFMDSWLGTGSKTVKYMKRPLLLLVTWLLAHLSTFYFEKPMVELGKTFGRRKQLDRVLAK